MDRTMRKPCMVPRVAISHLRASYKTVDKELDAAQRTRKSTAFTRQLMAWHDGGARPSACPLFTTYSTVLSLPSCMPRRRYGACLVL